MESYITTKGDYYFIMKYREKFSGYLSVLGYRLEINEEYGVVQLTNPLTMLITTPFP